jgi:hypothetical protein
MLAFRQDSLESETAEYLDRIAIVDAIDDRYDTAALQLFQGVIGSVFRHLVTSYCFAC